MPEMIHPRITGTVYIELSHKEAKTLAEAMDAVLELNALGLEGLNIRDLVSGKTCNDFLKSLRSVT